MKIGISLICLLAVTACSNPYTTYYKDLTNGAWGGAQSSNDVTAPLVRNGSNPDADYIDMVENGFILLGYSSFHAGRNINKADAISHAKQIKASCVLIYEPIHVDTRVNTVPIIVPNNQTTYTTTQANASTPYSNYYITGNTTSKTQGTNTIAVPVTASTYNYGASYWVKDNATPVFGVEWRDLTQNEKIAIGSGKGAIINAVRKHSPAHIYDFMRKDVVKYINGIEILDAESAHRIINANRGKKVVIEYIRNGLQNKKDMLLNN